MRKLYPVLFLAVFLVLVLWSTVSSNTKAALDVVVSEIAWMGTTAAWQDEWIELYNNTETDVDLTGWRLVTDDGAPDIPLQGTIPAKGYYLLERTDDTSVPDHTADLTYSGNLSNSPGEVITLTDGLANVIDMVGLSGQPWFAGNNTTKETMSRTQLTGQGTLVTSWANGPVNGTPQNSIVDSDGDTYGYSPNIDWAAGGGVDYEVFDEDCDDGDSLSHPGATEIPDGKDNDCDGQIDNGIDLGSVAWTTYFNADTIIDAPDKSTAATEMDTALIALVDAATSTVDAAIYGLDRLNVADALIAAHNRGVTVRVVGDDEAVTGVYSPTYNALVAAGIPVVADPYVSYIEHNKFAVLDGQIVWTGSTNWTDNGFTYNANNSIAVTAPHLAQAYTTEFEEMFVDGKFAHQKTDNTTHVFSYTNALVESYFSPSDGVEARVAEIISGAQQSLHFAMFYWTSDLLGQLVRDKVVDEGLTVSGVWDAVGAANTYSKDDLLCSVGVPLKVEIFGGKVHNKFAVVDVFGENPIVILGSYNWTASGAFDNDENTLIIHNAALAQAYYQEYLKLYNTIPEDAICSHHSAESGMPACSDGSDNDYDGYVDLADWDCRESTPTTCQDGVDNDGDGKTDTVDLDCYRCRLYRVGVTGEHSVAVGQPLTLTAWLSPTVAPGPLSYSWSGHASTSSTATYVWDQAGYHTVIISAANWCRQVSATHVVTVTGTMTDNVRVFLPMVVRNYPKADLNITDLVYEGADEHVEIHNLGSAAQDMTGWQLHSVAGDQRYSFPAGYTLPPAASARVHSGPNASGNGATDLLWSSAYIWNNDGDKAILYDAAEQVVAEYCYKGGCP